MKLSPCCKPPNGVSWRPWFFVFWHFSP